MKQSIKWAIFGVIILTILGVLSCGNPRWHKYIFMFQMEYWDPFGNVDYDNYIDVATLKTDSKNEFRFNISTLLNENGIMNVINNLSEYFTISVKPKDKDRAIEILEEDSSKKNYWIKIKY